MSEAVGLIGGIGLLIALYLVIFYASGTKTVLDSSSAAGNSLIHALQGR